VDENRILVVEWRVNTDAINKLYLPVGILQMLASTSKGFWYARSEVIHAI
jgi:nitric oxide reductase large subunit